MSDASNPAGLTVSERKYDIALPQANLLVRLVTGISGIPLPRDLCSSDSVDQLLRDGDARAAVVVGTNPTLVAAYSDEFDSVIILKIPPSQTTDIDLRMGTRLIGVFNYLGSVNTSRDISFGEHATSRFRNAEPLIGDLLSDDVTRLMELKQCISEPEWRRAQQLGEARIQERPNLYRLHRPGSTRTIKGDTLIAVIVAVLLVGALVVGLWMFA